MVKETKTIEKAVGLKQREKLIRHKQSFVSRETGNTPCEQEAGGKLLQTSDDQIQTQKPGIQTVSTETFSEDDEPLIVKEVTNVNITVVFNILLTPGRKLQTIILF